MKKDIIEGIRTLPPLPASVFELNEFRNIEDTNTIKLISIIEKDPLIVINILRIVNSSMFGFKHKVETLERAINLLGINFTISIAIGSAMQNNIKGNLLAYAVKNDDFIFTSALATNIINTWVSNINFDLKNQLLLPAFLQEAGKFIISQVIQKNRKTEEFLIELEETKDTTINKKKYTDTISKVIEKFLWDYYYSDIWEVIKPIRAIITTNLMMLLLKLYEKIKANMLMVSFTVNLMLKFQRL